MHGSVDASPLWTPGGATGRSACISPAEKRLMYVSARNPGYDGSEAVFDETAKGLGGCYAGLGT